jgi:hypothetical protein
LIESDELVVPSLTGLPTITPASMDYLCFWNEANRWCDRHGKQGVLNTASNSQLENEFGTKKEEDVVKQILEKGDVQSTEVSSPPTLTTYHRTFTNVDAEP